MYNDKYNNELNKCKKIMKRRVIGVKPYDKIPKAIYSMKKHDISQLPVIEDNVCVGVLTEKTIIKHLNKDLKELKVSEIMEAPFPIVGLEDNIEMVKNMLENELPLRLKKRPQAEMEAALRIKSATDQTVFLINWGDRPEVISFGLTLPAGEYRLEMWDVLASKPAENLKPSYSAKDLSAFELGLAPGGAFIAHVTGRP